MQHCDRLIKTVLSVGTAGDREIHLAPLAGCARLVYRQRGQRGYETSDKAAKLQVPDRFHDEVLSVSGSHPLCMRPHQRGRALSHPLTWIVLWVDVFKVPRAHRVDLNHGL